MGFRTWWPALAMSLLAACTSTAATTSTSAVATTSSTVAMTTTSTAVATTSTTSTTTTSTTTTTIPIAIDDIEVDLASQCGVATAWLAYASIAAWEETWALTHPYSQSGLPEEGGGYGSFEDATYQAETGAASAAVGGRATCSFVDFGRSFGEDVGIVALEGNGADGPGAFAAVVRFDADGWKVDNFAKHVAIISPNEAGEPEADQRVVFTTPLGTFDTLVVVDHEHFTPVLVESPIDPELAIGTWVPLEPYSTGEHVATVASMLENGVVAAQAVLWAAP